MAFFPWRCGLTLVVVLSMVALAAPPGAAAPGAAPGSGIDARGALLGEVAAALRADPVYVSPAAMRAPTPAELVDLRAAVETAGAPVFVAVLPQDAVGPGGVDRLPEELATATGRAGTYAVIAGDSFRAGSSLLPAGTAGRLATEAMNAHRAAGPGAVLVDFVRRVDARARTSGGRGGLPAEDGSGAGSGLGGLLLLGAAGGVVVVAWRRSRRRRELQAEHRRQTADRQLLQAELSVLSDDVLRLDPQVALHHAAQDDYQAAVSRYRAAQAALETREPVDLVRVARVVEEGRYAMARAVAIVDGREPPAPPEELRRPGRHGEPPIELDESRHPVYVGHAAPFATGWFGGGSGLLSGLMLGSMLGGWGWGPPGGFGHPGGQDDGGPGGEDWGEADWGAGGGDFGGSDFGGSDFGGGDFGGGD